VQPHRPTPARGSTTPRRPGGNGSEHSPPARRPGSGGCSSTCPRRNCSGASTGARACTTRPRTSGRRPRPGTVPVRDPAEAT
jgi:hypothetical protein